MSEQEMTIQEAADKLKCSYSWVHTKLPELGEEGCRRWLGRIIINSRGFEKLVKLRAESHGCGLHRGQRKRAAMCADWCGEHGMGAPKQEK